MKNIAKTQKEKNLKNPLDKATNLWYNKNVKRALSEWLSKGCKPTTL